MRIRHWRYEDQGGTYVLSDLDILQAYYPAWRQLMLKAGKADLITPAACIEDFVVVQWAWEIPE